MRPTITRSLIPLLFFSIATASASAYAEEPSRDDAPPPKTVYAKKAVLDFSALQLTGEVAKPETVYIQVPKRARFRCMVRTRESFRDKLEASVEGL